MRGDCRGDATIYRVANRVKSVDACYRAGDERAVLDLYSRQPLHIADSGIGGGGTARLASGAAGLGGNIYAAPAPEPGLRGGPDRCGRSAPTFIAMFETH